MNGALNLRLTPVQAIQLQAALCLAEHLTAKGDPQFAFMAEIGSPERYAFISLQLEVEMLNAAAGREQ